VGGELGGSGSAAKPLAEFATGLVEGGLQLMESARHPDGVGPVPEVAQDLAADGRDREGQEVAAALGVEAVDGLDQAEGGDLLEVVEVIPW
jgi:hypothetical protein